MDAVRVGQLLGSGQYRVRFRGLTAPRPVEPGTATLPAG